MSMEALLGKAAPSAEFLTSVVGEVLGRETAVDTVTAEREPYDAGSPATGALVRLRGTTIDGQLWSVFVKVLQSPRHWPHLDRVPPPGREEFIQIFPWRAELSAWDPDFVAALPPGLRVPRLYRLVELGDDRLAVWMEDVSVDVTPWPTARFAEAARLLGTLAGNRRDPALLAASPTPPGFGLRKYVDGPVRSALAAIADPSTWQHQALAAHRQMQAELLAAAERLPAIIDHLDALPQSIPHGDASPQNLLVPADDPSSFVAIDVAFQGPHVVGFDLAQLLVGLVHAGHMPATRLPEVHSVLVPAFHEGMKAGRLPVEFDDIERGYLATLVARAGFTSLPLRELDTTTPAIINERIALTRFILDRTRESAGHSPGARRRDAPAGRGPLRS
jgi:hypothetical protein